MVFMNYHLLESGQHISSVGCHLERPQSTTNDLISQFMSGDLVGTGQ